MRFTSINCLMQWQWYMLTRNAHDLGPAIAPGEKLSDTRRPTVHAKAPECSADRWQKCLHTHKWRSDSTTSLFFKVDPTTSLNWEFRLAAMTSEIIHTTEGIKTFRKPPNMDISTAHLPWDSVRDTQLLASRPLSPENMLRLSSVVLAILQQGWLSQDLDQRLKDFPSPSHLLFNFLVNRDKRRLNDLFTNVIALVLFVS